MNSTVNKIGIITCYVFFFLLIGIDAFVKFSEWKGMIDDVTSQGFRNDLAYLVSWVASMKVFVFREKSN